MSWNRGGWRSIWSVIDISAVTNERMQNIFVKHGAIASSPPLPHSLHAIEWRTVTSQLIQQLYIAKKSWCVCVCEREREITWKLWNGIALVNRTFLMIKIRNLWTFQTNLTASIFRLNFYKPKAVLSQTTKFFVLYDYLLFRFSVPCIFYRLQINVSNRCD
jgi:hypothetical protein